MLFGWIVELFMEITISGLTNQNYKSAQFGLRQRVEFDILHARSVDWSNWINDATTIDHSNDDITDVFYAQISLKDGYKPAKKPISINKIVAKQSNSLTNRTTVAHHTSAQVHDNNTVDGKATDNTQLPASGTTTLLSVRMLVTWTNSEY